MIVLHNLGLGDHILYNAIIRKLAQDKNIELLCKLHNYESVRFMYRDLFNVKIVNELQPELNLTMRRFTEPLDKSFYKQSGVDFDERWNGFYVRRDYSRENGLFGFLNIKKPYKFIHEDIYRNMIIKDEFKTGNVFYPSRTITNNIFDYCNIIENAEEVHCIESAFSFMIDSMNLNENTWAHRYSRKLSDIEIPTYKYINVKL